MATYEAIRGYDEGKTLRSEIANDDDHHRDINKKDGKDDVEWALHVSNPNPNVRSKVEEDSLFLVSKLHLPPHNNRLPRLISLDVFRGLTVALMIVVDDIGGIVPAINHSPWNGVTLADFVMPFFLFIVGISIGLTYKKLSSRAVATKKAIFRTLKLVVLGLFLQGGFFHGLKDLTYGVDIEDMRWMGILQMDIDIPDFTAELYVDAFLDNILSSLRIAVAYLIAAMCEIWLRRYDHGSESSLLRNYRIQWAVALLLTIIYLSLLYGLYVPDWEYQIPAGGSSSATKIYSVKCGVRGDTGPACNSVGMIDRKLLGIRHLYRKPIFARTKQCSINSPNYGPLPANAPSWCQAPFDPEGILSSTMSVVTCLVGLHYGHIIVHIKEHSERILQWMISSAFLIVLASGLDFCGMHVNKALYTFSYMCLTAGAAGMVFAGIYVMVDVYGVRRMTMVLEWMGMHALTIYVLAACNTLPLVLQGFYWRLPENNIVNRNWNMKRDWWQRSGVCKSVGRIQEKRKNIPPSK